MTAPTLIPAAHSPSDGDWAGAHRLEDHLRSVAALARARADASGAGAIAEIAGRWHDLGKYTEAFQRYIRGCGPQVSHKLAGAALAQEVLPPHLRDLVAVIIAGHHGGMPAFGDGAGERPSLLQRMDDARRELASARRGGAPVELLSAPGEALGAWLAVWTKDVATTKQEMWVALELLTRFAFGALVDADYRDTETFYDPGAEATRRQLSSRQSGISELRRRLEAFLAIRFQGCPDTTVNRSRREVLDSCRSRATEPPGVFELCVPTGGGKTLASLLFALAHAERHGLERVVIVLPFTAIIEQNAAVYAEALGPENVLEHHSALDLDKDEADALWAASCPASSTHLRHKLLAETWEAPVIVTTSVQLLESLHANLPGRCRKLPSLARSVIVLDEVQTLPVGLLEVTLDTLRMVVKCFHASLVLCTATQPALGPRTDPFSGRTHPGVGTARPIVAHSRDLFGRLRRVQVRWPADLRRPTSWEAVADEVRAEPRVLAITHRRRDAYDLATLLGPATRHLSALMVPEHRSRTLAEIKACLGTGTPCRVVSTQLVEAGVDIDFPVVYRALAGLDALAQSAGRCNREGRLTQGGSFRIFVAPTSPPPGVLEAALEVTRQLGPVDLDDPAVYRDFFEKLYRIRNTDVRALAVLRRGIHTAFPELARQYRLIENEHVMPVVIPWPALDALVLDAVERLRCGFTDAAAFRRLQRATVNAPRRLVLEWARLGVVEVPAKHPLAILRPDEVARRYSDHFGLDIFTEDVISSADLVL